MEKVSRFDHVSGLVRPAFAGVRNLKVVTPLLFVLAASLTVSTAIFTQREGWPPEDNPRYACYFVVALVAACLKIHSPERPDGTSMSFLFNIVALVELNLTETVLVGGSAILIQAAARRMTQTRALETLSTLVSTLSAVIVSQTVYRSGLLRNCGMEAPVRLVVAVVPAFIAFNVCSAAIGVAADYRKRGRFVDGMHLWSFPYHLIAAMITALYAFIYPFVSWYSAGPLIVLIYAIYRSYKLYAARLELQRTHASTVSSLHLRTIETLALAIEAKDHTTHEHLERVRIYAVEIGKDLGIRGQELEALTAAAVLHDIGKLAVPEHILSKPGKLTHEEFDKMKIHPVVGAEIVERAQFPYAVAPIVRAHHERWDGNGYPDGLKGEAIPIGARILAAVDCFNALASDRQYRRALPIDRSMQEISAGAGKEFDPRVVKALEARYRDLDEVLRRAEPARPLFNPELCAPDAREAPPDSRIAPPQFPHSIGAAREEVRQLFELAQELGSSLELRATFSVLSRGLAPLVPYDALALFMECDGRLTPRYVAGPDAGLCSSLALEIGAGVTGKVVSSGRAAVDSDPSAEGPELAAFGSMLSIPLTGRQGVAGALSLYRRARGHYHGDHLRLLDVVAPKLSLAIANGESFELAENSATTDYLTGLPNAHSLFVHLEHELEVSRYLSTDLGVLLCDLNGFKQINDTLGHLTGNRLLEAAGRALKANCREYDYVARMGGDEFVVVCSGSAMPALLDRIPAMRASLREAGERICGAGLLDSAFGAAAYPDDGNTTDRLLAAADLRMYRHKRSIKSGKAFTSSAA